MANTSAITTNNGIYTDGSDIFQTGSNLFFSDNSNVDHGVHMGFGLDFDATGNFDTNVSSGNTTTEPSNMMENIHDGAVSEAPSTPPHYMQYVVRNDDNDDGNKNEDWFDHYRY